jgi:hypothetical protein
LLIFFTHFMLIKTIKYNKPKAQMHFRFCIFTQALQKAYFFFL